MPRNDNLYFDAVPRLKAGIDKIARAVGVTMGTGGSNAILEAIESPGHLMTNDGYSIANAIVLSDPIEDMGRKMLLESINRANKASGDGSSTTCVLTAAMIEQGLAHTGEEHPMDIKRSMEACVPIIEESLTQQTRVIETNEIGKVATISAEDPAIGDMIQEIYEQIGKTGIIYWDVSKTTEDTYTVGSGITVEGAGFTSPYMCDATESGQNTNQIRLKNPKILITKQKIASAADFNDIGAYLNGQSVKDLIVFADEIDPLVLPDLIKTRMMRGFRFVVVKMPILWRDWWYEDLAKATGATIVDPAAGLPMKDLKAEHLGSVGNIVITKDDTFLDGIKDVSEHVKELEDMKTDEGTIRAARLNTKTARYFVGAASDSALSYRRLKVEDAISAAWQALNGGIVAGGGSALLNASAVLKDTKTVGARILAAALEAPARQIYANAGARVPDMFMYSGTDIGGFDSRSKTEISNMFEAGIIDPKNVVLNAVKNAVSVAASVITAPTIVTLPREERDADPLTPRDVAVR
jgi:chaperonin GroEL